MVHRLFIENALEKSLQLEYLRERHNQLNNEQDASFVVIFEIFDLSEL